MKMQEQGPKINRRNFKYGDCIRFKEASEHGAWRNMKDHCLNSNNPMYKYYGKRGIKICNRWINSYKNFIKDMGYKPSPLYSLDRINVNGNYEPWNCRWATMKQQTSNRRNNRLFTYKGVTKHLDDWANESSIGFSTFKTRIYRGWEFSKAFITPRRNYGA